MSSPQAAAWPLVEDLTLRERQILEQFAGGKSDREIAEKLMLGLSTVKWYARQIYGKLGVDNRRMAVQRGQELGLLGRLSSDVAHPDLPTFLTPFVGREQEMQEICHLLIQGDHRLVTLTGPGGIGKTRLAVQIVHRLAEQQPCTFADGICFVSLVGLTTPSAIVTAIGGALGVTFRQGINPQRQLCDELSPKQMLLVLDNMEHLLDDKEFDTVGFLLALLHAATELRMIVTSRVRLGVQGEQLYPIDGLAYPKHAVEDLPDVVHYSAVQLLLQHLRHVQPSYQMQGIDNHALGQICRLLEGGPLAIELAATWIRVMSCSEIAAELSRNLDLLDTTLYDVHHGQYSLRSVFERSWQLLSAGEKEVLSQLSVFRGGFQREDGEVVTGLTLTMLSRFVDHSLVRRQASGRFDLHEYLRQFLGEKLKANPSQWEQAHCRHSTYYGTRFAKVDWIFGTSQDEAKHWPTKPLILQVVAEIDNVGAAWRWAIQHQDAQTIRQLMNPLVDYYFLVGLLEEGGQLFDDAIAALGSMNEVPHEEKDSLKASLLLRRSLLLIHYQHHEALQLVNQSLSLLRQSAPEYPGEIALALVQQGNFLSRNGQNAEGIESIKEGLSIFQAQNHLPGMGYALFTQGRVEIGWGRLGLAADSLTTAIGFFEGEKAYQYWQVVHMLANVLMLQGRYQQSEVLFRTLIEYYANFHPPPSLVAYAWRNRGDLAIAMGNLAEAEGYFAEAATHFARVGVPWHIQISLATNPGVIARLQGDFDKAERILTQNVTTARHLGFQQRIAINLHNLARLRHEQGRYLEELALLDEALRLARQLDSRFEIARVLCQLGHVATELKQPEATRYYAEALQIATAEEIERLALDVLTGVAQRMTEINNQVLAVALLSHVEQHSASEFETKQKAHRLLVELEAQLPAYLVVEARQQGESLTLQDIVTNLLDAYLDSSGE